jgi:diguanylate cyclase (GGDEF)-like protein
VDAADGERRNTAVRRGYAAISLALTGLYPFLPGWWRDVDLLAVYAGAVACVVYGRHVVRRDRRRPWTLLLLALALVIAAEVVLLFPGERAHTAGRLIDAAGNLLILAAALAVILRQRSADLGGVIDAAVIAFAAGSLLWALLPHRLGPDTSFPAQVTLFVVVFALTGVLGALLRIARTAVEPGAAIWWLLSAIGLGIAGNILLALAGGDPLGQSLANVLFLAAFTAVGLFGLDPSGPRLVQPQPGARERLSAGRLAFLFAAVAVIPVVIGTQELLAGDAGGALLAVQGALVAMLVMGRIALLSAQRAEAERALAHQASHDPLTQLPNRQDIVNRVRAELARGTRCTLLFCDLDGFKSINDRYGHDAGDDLLVEVARRISSCVRPPHVVSRFGGDEFLVLLINATWNDGFAARDCIEASLRRPIEPVNGTGIGISIGVAQSQDDRDPDRVIQAADRDMYRIKASHASRPTL